MARIKNKAEPPKSVIYMEAKPEMLSGGADNYARFVICTRDVDRSGDIMEPKGCLKYLERFKSNPVWFYEHYLIPERQHKLIRAPIGKADGPPGQVKSLDIEITDDKIILGCWFDDTTAEARDVCRMVKNKLLRKTSVAFIPHKAEPRRGGGMHYLEWELTEASIVGIPDNPYTGIVESDVLRKSWGVKTMADDKPDEKPDMKPDDKDEPEVKPYAQVIADIARHHQGVGDYARAMADSGAHPKFTKELEAQADHADKQKDRLLELGKELYPDHDFDKMLEANDASPQPQDTKSYRGRAKGMSTTCKTVCKDAQEFMEDAANHPELPKSLKGGHLFHAKALGDMMADPDSDKDGDEGKKPDDKREEELPEHKQIEDYLLKIKAMA